MICCRRVVVRRSLQWPGSEPEGSGGAVDTAPSGDPVVVDKNEVVVA